MAAPSTTETSILLRADNKDVDGWVRKEELESKELSPEDERGCSTNQYVPMTL